MRFNQQQRQQTDVAWRIYGREIEGDEWPELPAATLLAVTRRLVVRIAGRQTLRKMLRVHLPGPRQIPAFDLRDRRDLDRLAYELSAALRDVSEDLLGPVRGQLLRLASDTDEFIEEGDAEHALATLIEQSQRSGVRVADVLDEGCSP